MGFITLLLARKAGNIGATKINSGYPSNIMIHNNYSNILSNLTNHNTYHTNPSFQPAIMSSNYSSIIGNHGNSSEMLGSIFNFLKPSVNYQKLTM